ncbi:MAG: hypothetical protein KAS30_00230, partial [Candidatus Diapherotrites archaeon]|nr:hypothetical protein [Candidatus Diapherotrites archaeon]
SKENLYEKYNLAFDEIFLLMDKIEEYELMLVQANDVIFNSELSFEDQGFFRQAIFSTSMLVDARQFNSLAVNFNESSKERFSMSKTEALTYADLSIQRINELAEIKELEDKVNKKAKDLESEVKNVINNSSEYKDVEGINELFDTWLLSIDNISKKEFETADQNLDKVSDLIKQVKNNGKKPAESFFQWEVIFGLALLILIIIGYKYREDIIDTFGGNKQNYTSIDSINKKEKTGGKTDEDIFPWEK